MIYKLVAHRFDRQGIYIYMDDCMLKRVCNRICFGFGPSENVLSILSISFNIVTFVCKMIFRCDEMVFGSNENVVETKVL
jgi:hypothetical protein